MFVDFCLNFPHKIHIQHPKLDDRFALTVFENWNFTSNNIYDFRQIFFIFVSRKCQVKYKVT